ncbi:hypothetical protein C8035_v008347 [Colletotrichum spinosum]|uniref:Uncharacterized protein n=1 Tax=Colletotrichum spinosum TaxID=1347390 RepID=A0A4R8QB29_9PEZI|nr:hypothetical protein C8035_v008347 [Colletotrichum spinosum]
MERVENRGSVSARLTRPSEDPSTPHVLDADVSEITLTTIWGKIACCLLQLSRITFPRIGSLVQADDGSYEVGGRPLNQWYTALAEMHIAQLIFQHNDLVVSEDDCRNKYVARQLFRSLARQGRLSTFGFAEDDWSPQSSEFPGLATCPAPSGSNSFRLWGDDFRAGNILLTEADDIAALIDWEYAYVAPTQFTLDPPWWLLIETAEMWSSGVDDWKETYDTRLKTWLAALERAEEDFTEPSGLPAPLSTYMRESWETGRFFLSYGARKSWAFDTI